MRGVYLILDPDGTGGRSPVSVAEAALYGGIHAIQWRQKTGSLARQWPDILRVRDLCRSYEVPFLVNDRVDVALALDADGAHVGQDDLPAAAARDLLSYRILGVSVTHTDQVESAVDAGADYLGVGPVFSTASKSDAAPPLGLESLHQVRGMTDLSLVAIGGITEDNAAAVMEAGADGIAVLSAICTAPDVEAVARTLVDRVERAVIR